MLLVRYTYTSSYNLDTLTHQSYQLDTLTNNCLWGLSLTQLAIAYTYLDLEVPSDR